MSELDDLEAYETRPTDIEDQRGANGRKRTRIVGARGREAGAMASTRQAWLCSTKRQTPSLPRLKFLERD
jgi:hypothetical protein